MPNNTKHMTKVKISIEIKVIFNKKPRQTSEVSYVGQYSYQNKILNSTRRFK